MNVDTRNGGSAMTDASSPATLSAMNGSLPVRSSNSATPSDQMSLRASTFFELRICSGDMYVGEPKTACVSVRRGSGEPSLCAAFEMPKSSTFTRAVPSARWVRKKFEGFRSRCTMPSACAAPRPSQI